MLAVWAGDDTSSTIDNLVVLLPTPLQNMIRHNQYKAATKIWSKCKLKAYDIVSIGVDRNRLSSSAQH